MSLADDALERRVLELETAQRDLTEALLDYVRADLRAPRMPAAQRLEKILMLHATRFVQFP